MIQKQVEFRFYEELNDFLPREKQKLTFYYLFSGRPTVKDAIEAIGIPHTEVDLILVDGQSVDFSYHIQDGERISVYPVFESLDISPINNLRVKPLREPKFILDVHLGKLAKFLRMLGFDTIYDKYYDDPEIVQIAKREGRIILTRDIGLLKNGIVERGYWLRSQNSRVQLDEVLKHFDLYSLIDAFSRCISCNGFVVEVSKNEIISKLKPQTINYYHSFYQCLGCQKVYWEGSHFQNMENFIDKIVSEFQVNSR